MPVHTSLVRATSQFLSFRGTSSQSRHSAAVQEAKSMVADELESTIASSCLLQEPLSDAVNFYERDEIQIGKLLQSGQFFEWYKIKRLPDQELSETSLTPSNNDLTTLLMDNTNTDTSMQDRASDHRAKEPRRQRLGRRLHSKSPRRTVSSDSKSPQRRIGKSKSPKRSLSAGEESTGGGSSGDERMERRRNKTMPTASPTTTPKRSIPKRTSSFDSSSSSHDRRRRPHHRCYYTLKQLRPSKHHSAEWMHQATLRLILECKFLARLDHPHILRVQGLSLVGEAATGGITRMNSHVTITPESFFLVTEHIVESLEHKLERWRQYYTGDRRTEMEGSSRFWREQLMYARDLASALEYLHDRNLIVVNLNPNTIGFLSDGRIQITDLSCCREIIAPKNKDSLLLDEDDDHGGNHASLGPLNMEPPSFGRCQSHPDDGLAPPSLGRSQSQPVTHVAPTLGRSSSNHVSPTPNTANASSNSHNHNNQGTYNFLVLAAANGDVPRYVAPEVILHQHVTSKADSYSWACVLFELLTLSKPYAGYKSGQHWMKVCMEGQRPNPLVYKLPKDICKLLYQTWRQTAHKRLSVTEVLQTLPDPHRKAMVVVKDEKEEMAALSQALREPSPVPTPPPVA